MHRGVLISVQQMIRTREGDKDSDTLYCVTVMKAHKTIVGGEVG